jgi:hypothetical protein
MCRCGCGDVAAYLCTGGSPEGVFIDEPCCVLSAAYLHDAAAELGFAFAQRYIGFRAPAPTGEEPRDG